MKSNNVTQSLCSQLYLTFGMLTHRAFCSNCSGMDGFLISLLKHFLLFVLNYILETCNLGYRVTNTLESEGLMTRPSSTTYWPNNSLLQFPTYRTKEILFTPSSIGIIHIYIHHGPENDQTNSEQMLKKYLTFF